MKASPGKVSETLYQKENAHKKAKNIKIIPVCVKYGLHFK
jgi:hypothetical protein